MNRWEIEVQKSLLDSEESALKELETQYKRALNDINNKVKQFQSDIDLIDQAINQDGMDDATKSRLLSNKRSKVYQQQYQQALKAQVSGILDKMHSDEYSTIDKYLNGCYETGYIGTMYSISGQGIPIIVPIDQAAAVKAILTDSKISKGLYNALGVDVAKLKKSISQEISRGIATSLPYSDIARNISNVSKAPLNRANVIARTEGHRIQQASTMDAQKAAKKKGADVVKQWDSTLDGKTRDTHRKLDGQIRELDEPFEVDGMKADAPGYFGDPAEDCNCRCVCNTRARWALDEEELNTLKERAEFFGLDKTKDFEDFKREYIEKSSIMPLDETVKITKKNGAKIYSSVDADLVNSKKYHDKFEGLTGHKKVNESIYQESMRMLEHRDGTPYEDMVLIDARTGKFVVGNMDSQLVGKTGLTENQFSRVKNYKGDLIIVHNHPNSSRVSYKDILTMYEHQNISAIVAVGHDGSVQIVSNINREIPIDKLWEKVYNDSVIQYDDKKIAEHNATTVLYDLGIFKTESR